MKLRLSEATEFRGKKYKKGDKADIPEGASFKIVASGKAEKISDTEFDEKPKKGTKNGNKKD
jgi:hypothetical protein